jgi:SAM-dependent methyltransferase
MSNKEVYEANLHIRFEELRNGSDQAYKLHELVFMEAFVFATELHRDKLPQRILDVGCGLGFMTCSLINLGQEAVGIDPSETAIELAKKEHSLDSFFASSAEHFSEIMVEHGIEVFDQAIINMVFHSVSDRSVLSILKGVRKCIKPEGTILILVPDEEWLMYKLIDYAQDQEMERSDGIAWVRKMLNQKKVRIPVRINSGKYYPEQLTIYNRSLEDYAKLLRVCNFGVRWESYDEKTKEKIGSQILPYLDMEDYVANIKLMQHNRHLLMSFAL